MSESYSHSQGEVEREQEFSPDLSNIPQTANSEQRSIENLNSYIRISGREQRIDEQGILEQFQDRRGEQQRRNGRNSTRIVRKMKIEKMSETVGKKYDFGYIKRKWRAQIQANIQKYKQYLKQHKQGYDFKQKQFMLDFFKILLDGIFQLREYGQSQHNDLTNNERKIIEKDSDQFVWLKDIVNSFDREFKDAKFSNKIESSGDKWKLLIKNCRDESNFELRRKIIRLKVKPLHVIMNKSEFLMSEQAKLQAQRLRKLILAQADKNFQKPIDQQQSPQQISDQSEQFDNNLLPQQLQSIRSMSANENMRICQQREKLQEYKEFINQRELMLSSRIEELLQGTTSYKRILENFLRTFGED